MTWWEPLGILGKGRQGCRVLQVSDPNGRSEFLPGCLLDVAEDVDDLRMCTPLRRPRMSTSAASDLCESTI
jgi:hypothetical protein